MAKKGKKMMGHRSRHDPSGIGVPIEPGDRETKKEAKKKSARKMTRRAARR